MTEKESRGSLMICEKPDTQQLAMAFNPNQLGINAVERLFWTLVANPGQKEVLAFGKNSSIVHFTNAWFEAAKALPIDNQVERVRIGVLNLMYSRSAVVVRKTLPVT